MRYVLDTSAVIGWWQAEDVSEDVGRILQGVAMGQDDVYISFMTVFESYYVTTRKSNVMEASNIYYLLQASPFELVGVEGNLSMDAGNLKVRYNLGVGDAWIAATAMLVQGILGYKDSDFDQVQEIAKLKIPT